MFKEKITRKGAVVGFTAAFLAMVGAAAILPMTNTPVSAAVSIDGNWEFTNNYITAYHGDEENVVIPSELSYISDKDLDENGKLDDVVTAEIKEVMNGVFANNTKIKSVTISEGIEIINYNGSGGGTFSGCTNITEINMPTTLTNIGYTNAFGDTQITKLTIKSDITRGNFCGMKTLESVVFDEGVTSVAGSLCNGCANLKSIEFSSTVKTIGDAAFLGCESLKSVYIPNTVESVGRRAFDSCSNLEEVTVGAKYIGEEAFWWNGTGGPLTELTLLAGVETIGVRAFAYQPIEGTVTLPDSVVTLDKGAFFNCSKISKLECGENLKTIGDQSFASCGTLRKVKFSDSIEYIGEYAFGAWGGSAFPQGSPIAGALDIPKSCKFIGLKAFYACKNITKINLPDGLETIDGMAFAECTGVKTAITIPDTVTLMGGGVFQGMTNLTEVKISNSLEEIPQDTFAGTGLVSVDIPDSVKIIGGSAFSGSQLMEVNFGSGLEEIGTYAFTGLPLKSVKFPDSLKVINEGAFNVSDIEVVENWPASLEDIKDCAFASCAKLKSIPPITGQIKKVRDSVFSGCRSLDNVKIEEGITEIQRYAFADCAITSIIIPDSVECICYGAFEGDGLLNDVYLGSGLEIIEQYAFRNTSLCEIVVPENVIALADGCIGSYYGVSGNKVISNDPDSLVKYITIPDQFNIYGFTDEVKDYADTDSFLVYNPETPEVKGDINGDGKVKISDVVTMQKYMVNAKTSKTYNMDLNNDEKENVFDVILLKRQLIYGE